MALSLAWGIDDTLTVNGREYPLNLEFSRVLRWYLMWQDPEDSEQEKTLFSFLFIVDFDWGDDPPEDLFELSEYIPAEDMPELSRGIIQRITGDHAPSKSVVRDLKGNILEDEDRSWYDFEEDSGYIYSSFLMDYGMDLIDEREKCTLHWDKFNVLLAGLSDDTHFKRVIKIRMMDYPENATQDQLDEIRKAKLAVALKKDRASIEFELMDLKEQREYMKQKER